MIRLQDIAEMAGVSRTTVSNVINGNTKRVSQKTIDKITAILKEQNYVPHMNYMSSARFYLCSWHAVPSGSVCGRTYWKHPYGNGRKRILCYAYRWRRHSECSRHCFKMEC